MLRRAAALLVALALALGAWAWWDVPPALSITKLKPWSGGPMFALVVGDDLRAGAGCGCADAIHVVGIPEGGGASILNLPRDTRVTYNGSRQKLNGVWTKGAEAMAAAVEGLVGVPIHYLVSVKFDRFPGLVDDLGGVTVDVPVRLDDPAVGLTIGPGPVRLDGAGALAYARSRKKYATGDLARTEAQARIMVGLLAQAQGLGPLDAAWYVGTLTRWTDVRGASPADLLRLARLGLGVAPGSVRSATMPGSGALIGGTSYIVPTSAAPTLFADFADGRIDGAAPPVNSSTVGGGTTGGGTTGGGTAGGTAGVGTTTAAPATTGPATTAPSTTGPSTTGLPATTAPATTAASTSAATTTPPRTTTSSPPTTSESGLAAPAIDDDGGAGPAALLAGVVGLAAAGTVVWLGVALARNRRRSTG